MLLLSFACLSKPAFAAEIDIKNAQLVSGEEGMSLSADFGIELNSRLEDAVARGLVLHFLAEFELNRPRWYWFDDTAANKTLTYQLSYHALTRQDRLSRGALHQSFPDLGSALKVLSRLRNWSSHIVSHLEGYLAATQLGITLASLGLGWVGESVVSVIIIDLFDIVGLEMGAELAHKIALPISFAIITVLHIVFGELAPKSMAIQKPEITTLFIAYPLNLFYYIFKPFIWVLNGFANVIVKAFGIHAVHGADIHRSDELKYLVQQSGESGTIVNTDYEIIKNAFDFADRTVKQVMVPRNQVVAIDISSFNAQMIDKILEEGY